MSDIVVILKYFHEKILDLLNNSEFTMIISICIAVLICSIDYLKKINFFLKYNKDINNLINNPLFNLLIISVVLYIYKYNFIIGILLFILYIYVNINFKPKLKSQKFTNYHIISE